MVDSRRLVTLALVAVILPAAMASPGPLPSRQVRQITTGNDNGGSGTDQSGEGYYVTGETGTDGESYSSGVTDDQNDYKKDGNDEYVESQPTGEAMANYGIMADGESDSNAGATFDWNPNPSEQPGENGGPIEPQPTEGAMPYDGIMADGESDTNAGPTFDWNRDPSVGGAMFAWDPPALSQAPEVTGEAQYTRTSMVAWSSRTSADTKAAGGIASLPPPAVSDPQAAGKP